MVTSRIGLSSVLRYAYCPSGEMMVESATLTLVVIEPSGVMSSRRTLTRLAGVAPTV